MPGIDFFAGGEEMSERVRAFDWKATPLGAPRDWPQPLKTLTSVMLAAHQPMFIAWGPERTLLYNDAYVPLLGRKHGRALGRPFLEVWAEAHEALSPLIERVFEGNAVHMEDIALVLDRGDTPEEAHFAFSYTPVRDETGAFAGLFCACMEITNAVLVERDRVWKNSRDLLVVIGADGVFRAVNPAWTKILGHAPSEVVGQSFLKFVWPEDASLTQGGLETAASESDLINFENRYRHKDGTPRHISWQTSSEGSVIYAYGRDVTAEKAAQAELVQAQDALRQSQKLEAMGQLTGGVAHDFNNLLAPIIGGLDMLQRRGVGGEREQRLIDGALQSAERAKILVQRLLAFARRQPLQPTAIDVASLIENMAELVSRTSGPQIKVVVEVAPNLPAAKGDQNQLEMAILNLSVNARDAMPQGGVLKISAVSDSAKGGHQPDLAPGAYVRVTVADTGVGMDELTLARAIEPFFSTKGVGKGTGLGLSMAHGLASQLGGALTLSSTPELGTSVHLWLPVSAEPAQRPDGPAAEDARPTMGVALLVEDEDLVRISTADMLSELGYAVVEAASAEDAMRMTEAGLDFDLLVTDHLMPGMTGVDLAHALRVGRPRLPVLIVSGFADVAGIDPRLPRLTKPFRQADLAASIAALSPR